MAEDASPHHVFRADIGDDRCDVGHRHGARDIKGKHFGEPIHRLLGGKRVDSVPAYASILFGRDGKETADIGRRWVEAGYRAVKFGWEPMGTSEAVDIDLVRGAREGLGSEATLLIDAGCVWDARTSLKRARAFEQFNIGWLEEPLRPEDVDGYVVAAIEVRFRLRPAKKNAAGSLSDH